MPVVWAGVSVVLSPCRGQSCQESAVLQVRCSEEESVRLALSLGTGLIKTRTHLSLFEDHHLGEGPQGNCPAGEGLGHAWQSAACMVVCFLLCTGHRDPWS